MAVDANVIIFERIKEEYRLGKSPQASIKAGFEKAFWTIMDANITTFIAALFLSQLGTGPVQGFAVTLAVGIVWSMVTALFLSRLIFDFGTDVLKRSRLSLGWGVR
jgi:preprotein translocase subunit SecD